MPTTRRGDCPLSRRTWAATTRVLPTGSRSGSTRIAGRGDLHHLLCHLRRLALILSSPVTFVAWRKNRVATTRNFMIGALAIALPCAILDVVSERQMSQCLDAGIGECLDVGRAGMQFLLIGAFAVTAWLNAFFLWRD